MYLGFVELYTPYRGKKGPTVLGHNFDKLKYILVILQGIL